MKKLCAIAAIMATTGCATNVWNKPGSSQDDFARDRYGCLQEAQQQSGSAYVNKFGGASSNGMTTNDGLFGACMNSRGWALTAKPIQGASPAITPWAETYKALNAEAQATCSQPEMQPIMSKSSCDWRELTLPQLADQSFLSEQDRPLFAQWRREVAARSTKLYASWRTHGGLKGAALASTAEATDVKLEQEALALYTGSSTWGQYNRQRKDSARIVKEAATKTDSTR